MQKKQSAKLARHNATASFFQNNISVLNSSPAFLAAVNNYRAKLANLNATTELEKQVFTGIAKGVRISKETLASQFAGNAALVQAMANTTGNIELADAVNFSESALLNSRNEDINKHCANILKAARTHLGELKDYGVDQTSLDTMEASLLNYNNKTAGPRNARSDKYSYRVTISQQLNELDDMLDTVLNKFVVPFKKTNPAFYNAYQSNRKIVDPATSHSQLKGHLSDSDTSKALANGLVTAVADGTTYTAVSNRAGNYTLKIPEVGTCEVTVSHADYETSAVLKALISLGKKTVLDVELKKKS